MSLQEEELVSSHAGQPEQASSLLDQIMAQTRIQPGSEGYDVARQGVTAFIASILQSTASAEPVNKLAVDSMIADIDERISRQMDVIIHAPAFQQVESFWRSLKTMVDRVDFRENIKVNVLHVTKQELLEDFEFAPEIIQSGFYKHVYSSGFGQFGGEPIAAVLGAYEFKNTAPDMKLLQYVSAVGAMAHAPFLSSVSPEFMGLNSWTELPNIKDLYAIFEGPAYTKWRALRDSEDSRYLGLTAPRFLLRQPYSPTDNPVKNFNYYEDVSQNHEDYLWGNTAWMLACNIADSFAKYRWCPNIIGPQSGGAVKDLPVHLFETMGQIQAKVTATSDLIQLRQGDEIQIGRLMVRVHLNRGDIPHYDEEMATPETIVTNRDMLTDTLLSTEGTPHYPGMTHRHQLADTVVNGFSADPLQALQSESLITTGDPLSGIAAVRPSAPLSDPASNGGINTPFMDLPPIYASPGDRNDDVSAAEMAQRHLAVTPLLRGLGGSLTMSNSDDADDFLEEAGRTLQAAIKGLLDLQQQRNSLSDKHLRPLEDNPLRLNMDYATALDVMFAEGKSPVHLAAPAAVSESLRNVRRHEEANRAAIVESLRVLLDAFSPQNLLRRFMQYRRSHELRQPLDDAGAWQMYSHYYEELASDRQQGFEMLFNEVYAQVYDRVLREKQREPEA
ncbi:type VI secretion system contractile sheath large subunit [Escherichia coli]|nr:type VI secretion system contractile sheath large subunit [Escherichia coli]